MGAFRTVIGCNFNQIETGETTPNRYLILDTQKDKNINASATIASQPLQNGDTMSDHMYREPVTFSIQGSFSLNGKNWNDNSYNFMEKGDRLTNIQEVFEYILNNGILCTITTIDENDYVYNSSGEYTGQIKSNAKNRFKVRKNMALNSINWTELQNTINYNFSFREVIMVEAQEYEELSEEEREALGLPNVTQPVGSSLGTILADNGQLQEIIIKSLYDNGYIENDFLRVLAYTGAIFLTDIVIAVVAHIAVSLALIPAAAIAGIAILGGTVGATSLLVPVGTIIAAGLVIITAIAIGIASLFSWISYMEKQKKAFKLIDGSAEPDGYRLQNLLEDIELTVNQVNSNLTIYEINENKPQQVVLNIAGESYIINFKKNNTNGEWYSEVEDMDGNPLDTVRTSWSPVTSINDLNRNSNLWFKDKSLIYEIYLMNPNLSEEINDTKEALDNVRKNLTTYSIWVSKGRIQDNVKLITDAINNAITSEGFV